MGVLIGVFTVTVFVSVLITHYDSTKEDLKEIYKKETGKRSNW